LEPVNSAPSNALKVPPDESGQRLDLFLAGQNLNLTRSRIQNLIRQGRVLVDGARVKPNFKVKPNQIIRIEIPAPQISKIQPEKIPLDIVYEDKDLLVVNKPAGMVTHPAAGNRSGTLVNALLYHCRNLSGIGGVARPGIVHRLDKDTSGLLLVAKNDSAHLKLSRQLQDKSLFREYAAVVWGKMPQKKGTIDAPIGRKPTDRKKMSVTAVASRIAVTEYEVKESFRPCELLSIRLKTGRTHQIRVHLAYWGHPVTGDPEYGGRSKWINNLKSSAERNQAEEILKLISRQALHARKIGFIHPATGQYTEFESRIPLDMQELLAYLRR